MDRLMPLANRIADQLKAREETIAISESSTGGLVSAALLAVPGASAYFVGAGVIYTREARRVLLGLPDDQVKMRGATEEYATLAAETIRVRMDTTWGLGESGAAGPTGSRYGNAAGHTCVAIAGPVARALTLETEDDDRVANMWRFSVALMELFEAALQES
jgi:nicotinamide-nucleotide amidase